MLSQFSLLCFVVYHLQLACASPDVPVSTQEVVTTITAPSVTESLSTGQTVIDSTSTYENIQTITTVDSDGNAITTTTDYGPVETVVQITSNVVATIAVTNYITFVSSLGESTIYGPDSTTSGTTSDSATAAATTTPSVIDVSPAPPDSTQTSTYVSLGITYAPITNSDSSTAGSTVKPMASPSRGAYTGSSGFPTTAPAAAHQSGMSTGAKAATGTAAIVVVIFLAILVFWLERLRRQRKAIAEQYPDGQASGDEAGIFGFFSPIVGKPYQREDMDEQEASREKDGNFKEQPTTMVQELNHSDITPPAVEAPQPPYRRPIPQRIPYAPHSPVSPVSPVHDPMVDTVYPQARTDIPDSPTEVPAESFRKGFPRPLGRYPSHHATRSSGNVTALPEFFEKG